MRLKDKRAIVTGGAGGIGAASSKAFAAEGAKVLVCDKNRDGAEAVAAAIRETGGQAWSFGLDVRRAVEVSAMVSEAESRFGGLDIIFNNAGVFHDDDVSVTLTDEEVWNFVIDVNLKGVFLGCKYAIPALLRAGGGSIINTASFVAVVGAAVSQSAYTASKGGVLALTREIAVEYARKGIRANSLCPGPINTPLLAELLKDRRARERRFVHIPMGRLGEAEEIARSVVFLAADESSYLTGTDFLVDGGICAAYVTPESD